MLESQKRAIKNYVEKNREKVNEYNRIRYNKIKKENEEKYKQILASKNAYYHRKKSQKENEVEIKNDEIIEEIKE